MQSASEMIEWLDNNCLCFSIERNDHKVYYSTVDKEYEPDLFISDDDRTLCITQGSAWSVRVYPDTPVSFFLVAGSDLNVCLNRVIGAVNNDRAGS